MRVCPICNCNEYSVFMNENAYSNRDHIQLLKCSNCGFVYSKTSEFDYENFGQGAVTASLSDVSELSKTQGVSKLVDEIISKSAIYEGNVLDFACGMGLILVEFMNKGYNVIGIDKSKAFRDFHTENGIFSVPSLVEINDKKNYFDLIILKDILEHLDDPVGLLEEVVTYLKPSGFLYVRVPNRYAYPFELGAVDTKSHINHFTPSELQNILKKSGLLKHEFIKIYDVRSKAGRMYNSLFWKLRYVVPMYHQISILCKKH